MGKMEFLDRLRQALGNDLSGPVIQENVEYYNGYIMEEVRKGRTESEVIEELGDPWVIAQTIIDSVENRAGNNKGSDYSYEPNGAYQEEKSSRKAYAAGFDSWWKKARLVLGVVGIFLIVLLILGGLISFIAPLIMPLLVIWFVVSLFGGKK